MNEENSDTLPEPDNPPAHVDAVEPSEPIKPAAPQEPVERGLGQLLSSTRENLGLSIQEVADAMHITMHYVRALEADAHEKLPGDVFIKGYLRSYGNILGLDPVMLIDLYSSHSALRDDDEQQSVGRYRYRRRNRNLPWIVFSGIAFIGMAIALWFFSSGADEVVPAKPAGRASSAAPSSTIRPASPGASASLDQVGTTRQVPSAPAAQELPLEQSPLTAPDPVSADALLDATNVPATLPTESVPQEQAPAASAPALEPQASAEEATQQPASSAAAVSLALLDERVIRVDTGGQDLVQIRFKGESMVQVHDASEEQIYRDVRGAGDVLSINGTAPFNILLGDAANSEMSLNGELIDFSASIRIDNSARLTIGL